MKAVFVKLGGSLITDKSSAMTANQTAIQQICAELADLYRIEPDMRWFVGNGAGSFGHYMVHRTGWKDDPHNMLHVAQVRQATAELNRLVYDALLEHDVPAVVFPAAAFLQSRHGKPVANAGPILEYVQKGAVASVYGDVIVDDQKGTSIASTELILEELAQQWVAQGNEVASFIYCTSVDGVLDSSQKVIPELRKSQVGNFITGSEHQDVTGGMLQKVHAGFANLRFTDAVYIINGQKQQELSRALQGAPVGTRLVSG